MKKTISIILASMMLSLGVAGAQESTDVLSTYDQLIESRNYYALAELMANSLASSAATAPGLKRITRPEIVYSHMGQLIINDGICYVTFLQNRGDGGEKLRETDSEVVLSVFSLDKALAEDFDPVNDVREYRIGGMGDKFLGYKANSIFKDNSMCLEGNTLHIVFQFLPDTDDKAHVFKTDFDIRTHKFSGRKECRLIYKGRKMVFCMDALNEIYGSEGYAKVDPKDNIIELVSQWSGYDGMYYATLECAGNEGTNGMVVRTRDFEDFEFVTIPPFNRDGMAEISSIIKGDRLYVACRQDYGIPYLYLAAFDLKEQAWNIPVKVPDGNSRPWFFVFEDRLYLMNTLDEKKRRYTNVSEVTSSGWNWKQGNSRLHVTPLCTLKDCGYYYATAVYDGHIYMVVTHNTLSFGQLKVLGLDPALPAGQ